jgi:aquaporin Z
VRAYLAEFLGVFFVAFTYLSTASAPVGVSALAVGSVVTACVWAGAHLSGGHYNPAVSLAAYLRHRLSLVDLWSYWAAQLGGALSAALVAMVALPLRHRALDVTGSGVAPALVVEALFTFALVYVVLSVRTSTTQERNVFPGVAVGAVVLVGALTVGALSGAAFNPAVAFAMTVDGEFGWPGLWVYLVAEVLGALAAAAFAARSLPAQSRPAG